MILKHFEADEERLRKIYFDKKKEAAQVLRNSKIQESLHGQPNTYKTHF